MKKIINNPKNVVSETLKGLTLAKEDLVYVPEAEVVYCSHTSEKVGLVSGGGSGHEPAHAGYVGYGLLDAAVAGNIFSSPGPDRILEGIRRANHGKGVLLVIKNYSGDIMNFDMAKDLAEMEGIFVDSVVVRDDVAVEESTYSTGRRGVAGTVFVHKIAGAKAREGAPLEEVKRCAQKAIDATRTMGMAMSACTIPEVGRPNFVLGDDEMEIGMGIHGEPGVQRSGILSAKELAERLLSHIFQDRDYRGKRVALLVNGLGATPLMELYILHAEVCEILKNEGITVVKHMVGNYMTALDMAGASVSLMEVDEELERLLLAPCDSLQWKETLQQ